MKTCDMAAVGSALGLRERLFVTRERGEQAYGILRAQLERLRDGHPLVVSFPRDQLVDASFADESIIRLGEQIVAGEFGERCILLEGISADSITNIDAVISLRGMKLALLAVEADGKWQVVGQLEPSLRDTLETVAGQGRLTAPELAKLANLAINSASNRLKRLYDQRLLRREYEVSEKGLQYIYYFWQWAEQ